ncbi:DEAD/DEAH box helicase family protein [Siccirubricoccus deserti]
MLDTTKPGSRVLRDICARMSLRLPQEESLTILADVLDRLALKKDADLDAALALVRDRHPTVEDFERAFPSLCFALATGVGKTRLMGAFIGYLYLTGRSRNFFVLAPNTTIYQKLVADLTPGTLSTFSRASPSSRRTRRSWSRATPGTSPPCSSTPPSGTTASSSTCSTWTRSTRTRAGSRSSTSTSARATSTTSPPCPT